MWKIAIWSVAKWVFTKVPLETLLAQIINWTLGKISNKNDVEKVSKTITHCNESLGLLADVIADAEVDDNEVKLLTTNANKLRVDILTTWAKGDTAKKAECELGDCTPQ